MDISERLKDESTWRDGWQTRDGREVEIAWDDMGYDYPIGGRIKTKEGDWISACWERDGRFSTDGNLGERDLVPRPAKHSGWIAIANSKEVYNIADFLTTDIYATRELLATQIKSKGWKPIACIPVTFYEGEGIS